MAENLLGKNTPLVEHYAPELLFPIPRSQGRENLGLSSTLPFQGEDIWHAWELSWLNEGGLPQVAVARFHFPCETPQLVESKSFKLYLNSLNQQSFASVTQLSKTLESDISAAAGGSVNVEVLPLDSEELQITELPGQCIDQSVGAESASEPNAEMLQQTKGAGGCWHSHLLRSLCPVTAQPDWGSIIIEMDGAQVTEESLLAYLLSFRGHQEFHEQCVERVFLDLQRTIKPTRLSVQALYTRRGGLDISPWRSTDAASAPLRRTSRQ